MAENNKYYIWVIMMLFKRMDVVRCALLVLGLLMGNITMAQTTVSQARKYAADKNMDKALEAYGQIYAVSPDSVYTEYVIVLLDAQKFKVAEKVVEKQMKAKPEDPFLHIDLGNVYLREGKADKAREQFDGILQRINGDDMLTQRIAKAFVDRGNDNYAILAYEKATKLINVPYYYSLPLATLYAKTDSLEKAIDILLIVIPGQGVNVEAVKTLLLELLGNNANKIQLTQKALIKKINQQPDNVFYAMLLTWIYTKKDDWDGALIQIEAVDERNREDGRRLMDFAHEAVAAKKYPVADKAYDDVIAKGREMPFYLSAKSEKIGIAFTQLKSDTTYAPAIVQGLAKLYDSFLIEFPKYYSSQTAGDYAMLEAQYAHDVPRAIEILKRALSEPGTRGTVAGNLKLQMGDYYLLNGQVWDASLTYSQVDKEFKQDALGEDARFRNAKLAYYRGDFEWAQRQLSILKASTSELIANDALYLSVLITENVEDSNYVPLQRFAYAGLLLFQNRDREAEVLLDSINKAYPKHPLNDDIIMARADLAVKHRDFNKALDYLKTIYEKYGQDVLADDALFKMADIYEYDLNQKDQAKHYYEQLIIDYPGSTYVQVARQRLTELNNGIAP